MSNNQIDPKILFNQAMAQKKNKDYLASIDTFNKITKIEPNIYEVFFNLGNIFYELGIFDSSILNFKKAIDIYKLDPEVYTNLANAFIEKKMYPDAQESLKKAFNLSPNDFRISNTAGMLNIAMEKYTDAKNAFEYSLTLDKDNHLALTQIGAIFLRAGDYQNGLSYIYKASGRIILCNEIELAC